MTIKPEIEYQVALDNKNSEGQIQWNRFNAMLVVNTIFIALIVSSYEGHAPSFLRLVLTPLGVFLCFLWGRMTARGFMWTRFWSKVAFDIETKFSAKDNIKPYLRGKDYRDNNRVVLNTEYSSYMVILIFSFIYILLFFVNLCP